MIIDLVHVQPLFREGPDVLVVKYTHPETGVHIEIPYEDLVNTVLAVDAMLTEDEPAAEEQPPEAPTADEIVAAAPSGLRVMRSRVELDDN